jgi:CheY-like chemotaxis protein
MRESLPRVLVVDDDAAVLEALSAILQANGFACRTAGNGFEALKALRITPPDIIISDLRMPQMSGFELLPIVRRRYPQITIIVMSAEPEESVRPLGLPIDAYLQKGTNATSQLLILVRNAVSDPHFGKEHARGSDTEHPT